MKLSEDIVTILLDGVDALVEDRIDDLIRTYGKSLPAADPRKARELIDKWAVFDPHPRKKYLPWIVKQVAQRKLEPTDQNLDHLRDQLRSYERLQAIPDFTGNRDIFAYDWPTFDEVITSSLNIRSQSEKERAAKAAKKRGLQGETGQAGVTKIAEVGNLALLEITDAVSLSWWSWKAYDRKFNPNWKKKTIPMPPPEELQNPNLRDGYWCVRYPTYGLDYINDEPTKAFYLVLKNGGPYVGILLSGGQWKDLENDGINTGVAEEIYPVVKDLLDEYKSAGHSLGYEGRVFDNLRFVNGEVQPGEVFDDVDLDGSSIAVLPDGCTFSNLKINNTKVTVIPAGTKAHNISAVGSALREVAPGVQVENALNVSDSQLHKLPPNLTVTTLNLANCPITQLPENLEVKASLHIEGTGITELPQSLVIGENMTWSAPLSIEQVKGAFYRKCMPDMIRSFQEKVAASPKLAGKSEESKQKAWEKFKATLWNHFQTDPGIDTHVRATFVERTPNASGKAEEE